MLKDIGKQRYGTGGVLPRLPWSIRKSFVAAARPIELRAREVLFHAGDNGDGCYIIRSGAVKASVVTKDGQERLLAVLGPGSLIGELALIDNEPRSATVSALRPARLLHLAKGQFFRMADENPVIYRQALRLLSQRLRGTNETVVAQGTVTVVGRVARAFASLADGLGDEQEDGRVVLSHRITQTDIAAMAGVARENASRAINDLLRRGVLGRAKGFYVIEKPAILIDMTEV